MEGARRVIRVLTALRLVLVLRMLETGQPCLDLLVGCLLVAEWQAALDGCGLVSILWEGFAGHRVVCVNWWRDPCSNCKARLLRLWRITTLGARGPRRTQLVLQLRRLEVCPRLSLKLIAIGLALLLRRLELY